MRSYDPKEDLDIVIVVQHPKHHPRPGSAAASPDVVLDLPEQPAEHRGSTGGKQADAQPEAAGLYLGGRA